MTGSTARRLFDTRYVAAKPRVNSHHQISCRVVRILIVVRLLLDSQPSGSAIFFAQKSGIGGSVIQDPPPATGPGFALGPCYHSTAYCRQLQVQVCVCLCECSVCDVPLSGTLVLLILIVLYASCTHLLNCRSTLPLMKGVRRTSQKRGSNNCYRRPGECVRIECEEWVRRE